MGAIVQLAQAPGVALRQAPRTVPLVLAPELLGRWRIIAAQRPIPEMSRREQGKLSHTSIVRGETRIDDVTRPIFTSRNDGKIDLPTPIRRLPEIAQE
ncbi:hypothetical protein FB565_007412 [Actinoplanes lutulentus]|uniref:hypothetical protein n=1 Tax=Actinoplanes lutulentus TaxID=1287878 RepID=UPI0015ECCC79|nr:hypothetical protein [Actinoplanes lutulentus]MBB2947641.1 hypothetical protein [Actinoplanes lutulentus]